MASLRDKDYHKLRNSEKYFGKFRRDIHIKYHGEGPITKEEAESAKQFDKLHEKYGFKSMVGNKRRRNTTRKSNQKWKPLQRQIRRAKEKQETRESIQNSI